MHTFSCRISGLLISHFRAECPLKPPFKLISNGLSIADCCIGVAVNGTQEFFLVTRLPDVPTGKLALQLIESDGTSFTWSQRTLTFSEARWKKNISIAGTLALLRGLSQKLSTTFGELADGAWPELVDRFSTIFDSTVAQTADGRLYWRTRSQGGESDSGLTTIRISCPPERKESAEVLALLDKGYLHAVIDPKILPLTGTTHALAKLGESRYFPVRLSAHQEPESETAVDSYTEILRGYAGNSSALAEYLRKIAGMKPALDETGKSLAEGIRGRITELQNTILVGWALDKNHPADHIEAGLSVDGDPLATMSADLPNKAKGQQPASHHGFAHTLPENLLDGAEHTLRLTIPNFPDYPVGRAFLIGSGHFDGHCELESGRYLTGWLRERCLTRSPVIVHLSVDGAAVESRQVIPDDQGVGSFRFALPYRIQDGSPHRVETSIYRNGDHLCALGQPIDYQAKYRGAIIKLEPSMVSGWIVNDSAPDLVISLDLYVNGVKEFTAETKPLQDSRGNRGFAFAFYLDLPKPEERYRTVAFYLAGTQHRVLGPDRIITPVDTVIESLNRLSGLLRASDPDSRSHEWVRRQILAPLMLQLRRSPALPDSVNLSFSPVIQATEIRQVSEIIDVVVPVYSGLEQTLNCLDSLEAAANQRPCEIVVINDSSPEPRLTEELRQRASAGRITLLENSKNLGFVASCNRGLKLHPDRDAILLNSDTVAPSRWLDRLHGVAYANPAIGTVTPLSNNASICSFPNPNVDNALPAGWTLEELDRALEESNGTGYHDLPTAVGFCMYIKRQLLDEIGYLDEHEWGKGYGEENDLSLRAAALGWRNVSADGLLVQHEGSVSFREDKSRLLSINLAKLHRLYPEYAATVQRFVAADPLAEARNPVIKRLLQRHAARYMLFVTHGMGGGTQIAIDDLCDRLAAAGTEVLELSSRLDGKWQLRAHGTEYAMIYPPTEFDRLLADLRDLAVWHVHFHQTPFFPRRLLQLPEQLAVGYDVTVHDYLPVCPRINMLDETGWYCGDSQRDAAACNRCIADLGPEEGVEPLYAEHGSDVATWRSNHGKFLNGARRVFMPSKAVEHIMLRHFPLTNAVVQPHPEPAFQPKPAIPEDHGVVKIAVIGAIGAHKGYDLLLACARTAQKDGLPLRFAVVGYTQDDAAFDRLDNVTITGPYQRQDLPELLARQGCSVALFLSPWPETYCYALTEAWRSGLYPVAFDLGAPAERIREAGYGDLMPLTANPKQINRSLLEAGVRARQPVAMPTIGRDYPSILADYYHLDAAPPTRANRRRRR